MSVLQTVSSNVENIPGFSLAADVYEQYAPDQFKTRDPFYTEVDGVQKKRRAPATANERQRQAWKQVIRTAWTYDRNFCCGCVGMDIGLGIIPIVNVLPVIGPIIAYTLQGSLIRKSSEGGAPASLQAKMAANCGTDFLISLCPLLGVLFSWMFGCATRNAALFDAWLAQKGAPGQRKEQKRPKEVAGPVYDHGGQERGRIPTDTSGQNAYAPAAKAQPPQSRAPAQPPQPTQPVAQRAQPQPRTLPQSTQPAPQARTTPAPYRPPTVDL